MQSTSLTYSPTIPARLRYDSPIEKQLRQLAEFRADSEIWDLHSWPSREPTLEEIYWIAGIFEGEGSLTDRGTICIWQKDREILDRVRVLVGGRVGLSRRVPSMYYWHASGPRARGVIRTVYPLLSTRRKAQARRLLRISRGSEEPRLDPFAPTKYLWDFQAPGSDELE